MAIRGVVSHLIYMDLYTVEKVGYEAAALPNFKGAP